LATGKFRRFEDILAWQQARTLVNEIYNITSTLETFRRDPKLSDKLQSTAINIMTYIAKGFGSKNPTIFSENLREAMSAAAEIQSLLYISADLERIDRRRFEHLANMTQICVRMIQELHTLVNKKIENLRRNQSRRSYGRIPPSQPPIPPQPNQQLSNRIPPAQPVEQPTRPSRPVRPQDMSKNQAIGESGENLERPDIIPTYEFNRIFVEDNDDEE